jgi:hypothetical protein
MDDYENPKPNKTYISPSLPGFIHKDRKVRIASKVIESPDSYAFATVKDETILRHKKNAKTHIKAKFLENDRRVTVLSIQGYSVATEKPHNASFSFVGDEIGKLLEFISNIKSVSFKGKGSVNITDEELRHIILSEKQAKNFVEENEELFTQAIQSSVTKRDIVAIGYRKKELEVFQQLLNDPDYFNKIKARKKCTDENLWQQFFERNPWIFGYGLSYIYLAKLDDKKLEQVVQGYYVGTHGKRTDALLKSKGIISNLCFVEIKTHKTTLLDKKSYREDCWSPTKELAGAVSQVQGTVASAADTISNKLSLQESDGSPSGEEVFNYSPKAYLIVP